MIIFLLYCTCYGDLSTPIFHEMGQQNSEIFWCADDQMLELQTLSQKLGKDVKMDTHS